MSLHPGVSLAKENSAPSSPIVQVGHDRLNGLDHVRATAIVLVLFFHYRLFQHPEWVNHFGNFGWSGVDMFFVLSGYLIGGQLLKQASETGRINLREFYIKRFFRILPVYYFILAMYFLFPSLREWESPAPLWKYLSFTQNVGLDLRTQRTFSHAWSLCIEEQFYLFFPLLLMLLLKFSWMKRIGWFMLAIFISGFAIRYFTWQHFIAPALDSDYFGVIWHKWIYYPVWTRLDGLLTGVGIAALIRFRPAVAKRIFAFGNGLLVIAAVLIAAAFFLCDDSTTFAASVFGFPVVSIAYGTLIIAALSPQCILYGWSSSLTRQIAILSYSIYLSHKIVIHLIQGAAPQFHVPADSTGCMILAILASVVAAWLMHQLIEKPFMKLRDRILSRIYRKPL